MNSAECWGVCRLSESPAEEALGPENHWVFFVVAECSVAVVLRAAAQCSQRHVYEFNYRLRSAPWTYVFGFRPVAPCFGYCSLWLSDVENGN